MHRGSLSSSAHSFKRKAGKWSVSGAELFLTSLIALTMDSFVKSRSPNLGPVISSSVENFFLYFLTYSMDQNERNWRSIVPLFLYIPLSGCWFFQCWFQKSQFCSLFLDVFCISIEMLRIWLCVFYSMCLFYNFFFFEWV